MSISDPLDLLYREQAPALFRFLMRLTGDEAEVKDVLQEVFIRLARSPELLRGVAEPRAYLFRMAHRLVIDRVRREATRRRCDEQARLESEWRAAPELPDLDEAWRRRVLEELLAALPLDQKAVVLLKVWERMTFAEIGEALEISANTAASRYRYALDKLRGALRPLQRDLP